MGLDMYQEFLQEAQKRQRARAFIQGNVVKLPFPTKAFDCTYSFDVLEHVDDEAAIEEMARVTVQRLILTVPKEDETFPRFGLTFFHYQDQTHLRYYTEASLSRLLSRISYSHVSLFPELVIPTKAMLLAMLEPGKSSLLRRVHYHLMKSLINERSFRTIYAGLVAVVDLGH